MSDPARLDTAPEIAYLRCTFQQFTARPTEESGMLASLPEYETKRRSSLQRRLKYGIVLAILLVGLSSSCPDRVEADTLPVLLYQQPPVAGGTSLLSRLGKQMVADDWVATSSLPLGAVRWWGTYEDANNPPATDYFAYSTIGVDSGPGGLPGGNLGPVSETVNRTATDLFDGQGRPLFQFDAHLFGTPQVVGQRYWLILFSGFNGPSGVVANEFLWAQGGGGNNTEAVGDNYAFRRVDGDRAFALFFVPGPSAFLLLVFGLVALTSMAEWQKHRGR